MFKLRLIFWHHDTQAKETRRSKLSVRQKVAAPNVASFRWSRSGFSFIFAESCFFAATTFRKTGKTTKWRFLRRRPESSFAWRHCDVTPVTTSYVTAVTQIISIEVVAHPTSSNKTRSLHHRSTLWPPICACRKITWIPGGLRNSGLA